jgi:ABC-type multidrug transport system permease subunit
MRTAAVIAATVIMVGVYLVVAASVNLPPSWIGLGMLGIAATFAIGLVASARPAES